MVRKRHDQLASMATGTLVAGILLFVTACSGGQEYATPERVCGVPVDSVKLKSLLIDGKKVYDSESEYGDLDRHYSCKVGVDRRIIIAAEGEWHETKKTPVEVAHDDLEFRAEQRKGDDFAAWPGGVAKFTECRNEKKEARYFSLITTVEEKDQKDFEKNADAFARDLTEKLIAKQPCEKG